MFCFKCGAKIEDDSKFCPICGANLEESNENVTDYAADEAVVPQKKKSRKKIVIIVMAVIILAAVAAVATYFMVEYGCKYGIHDNHKWNDATCDLPMTCSVCGGTQGEKLGHDLENANCTTPKTCKRCGHTEGNSLGHMWQRADCTNPKKCKRCDATEGEATGHQWEEATCKKPKTCSACGKQEGAAAGHKFDSNKICTVCGYLDLKVGNIVKLGSYEQDGNSSNGKESIEWQVLAVENGKALLISKYGLEQKTYNTSSGASMTWENCSLRKWLNNDFYDNAFTSSEKNKIVKSYVTADKNPKYNTNSGYNTYDNVFVLSINEVNKYFGSDSSRKCTSTKHARNNGVDTSSNGCCWWWLRSPGYYTNYAAEVENDGAVYYNGHYVNDDRNAVRPAMWINL